jgi:hypothetical protein
MKVYLTGRKPRQQADFIMCVAPAALVRNQEIPEHWLEANGSHVQMKLEFKYGEAEIEDGVAELLIKHGYVVKSKLLLPRLPPSPEELLAMEALAQAESTAQQDAAGG